MNPPRKRWRVSRARPITGLGDAVALVAQPIAAGIDAVFRTDLQNCSACDQRKQDWNRKFPFPEL
jgi:hypothetical protein